MNGQMGWLSVLFACVADGFETNYERTRMHVLQIQRSCKPVLRICTGLVGTATVRVGFAVRGVGRQNAYE